MWLLFCPFVTKAVKSSDSGCSIFKEDESVSSHPCQLEIWSNRNQWDSHLCFSPGGRTAESLSTWRLFKTVTVESFINLRVAELSGNGLKNDQIAVRCASVSQQRSVQLETHWCFWKWLISPEEPIGARSFLKRLYVLPGNVLTRWSILFIWWRCCVYLFFVQACWFINISKVERNLSPRVSEAAGLLSPWQNESALMKGSLWLDILLMVGCLKCPGYVLGLETCKQGCE